MYMRVLPVSSIRSAFLLPELPSRVTASPRDGTVRRASAVPHNRTVVSFECVRINHAGTADLLEDAVRRFAEVQLDHRQRLSWHGQRDTLTVHDGLSAVKGDEPALVTERLPPAGTLNAEKARRQFAVVIGARYRDKAHGATLLRLKHVFNAAEKRHGTRPIVLPVIAGGSSRFLTRSVAGPQYPRKTRNQPPFSRPGRTCTSCPLPSP